MSLVKRLKRLIFQGRTFRQIHNIKGHLGFKEGRLLFKIAKSLKDNSVIVEIGAFLGKSTCFIAEGIGSKKIDFYTIDTWRNDKMQ